MNNSLSPSIAQRFYSPFIGGLTVAWAGLIFFLSTARFGGVFTRILLATILALVHVSVSAHAFAILHHLFRKCAHLTEYGIFAMLLYHLMHGPGRIRWQWRKALLSIVIAGLYSTTDEFHQRLVPGRGPSPVDCVIDTLGATLGISLVYMAAWLSSRSAGRGHASGATST